AVRHLRGLEFEPVGKLNLRPMLRAGDGVFDRFGLELSEPWDLKRGGTLVAIRDERNRGVDRMQHLGYDRREDLEERAAVLTTRDGQERLPLLGCSVFVDCQLQDALAQVDRTGPPVRGGKRQPAQLGVAEITLSDVGGNQRLAPPPGRQSVELAGTSPRA